MENLMGVFKCVKWLMLKKAELDKRRSRWWFQVFFLAPIWGDDPIWRIFFKLGSNNQPDICVHGMFYIQAFWSREWSGLIKSMWKFLQLLFLEPGNVLLLQTATSARVSQKVVPRKCKKNARSSGLEILLIIQFDVSVDFCRWKEDIRHSQDSSSSDFKWIGLPILQPANLS